MPRFLSPITPNASTTSTGPVKVGDGINVDADGTISVSSGNQKTWYGICESTSSARTKVVTCENFELEDGAHLSVWFRFDNTANTATLNVNSTGAKSVAKSTADGVVGYAWQQGAVVDFVYEASSQLWVMIRGAEATTTYYGVTKLTDSVTSTDTGTAATPNSVKQAYDLANGKQDALVSGTNIKTINGNTLLGSGDIEISGGSGGNQKTWYGTCHTAAGTAAKVVTCSNFVLEDGVQICVYFTNANTSVLPTLNVNNTGAVDIGVNGNFGSARYMWQSCEMVTFVYYETDSVWIMTKGTPATTTYYGPTKLSSSTSSTSTSLAATPYAVKQAYDLANKQKITITTGSVTTTNIYVNGKQVYVKRINVASLPNNGTLTISTGITQSITPYRIEGMAYRSTDKVYFPIPYGTEGPAAIGINYNDTDKVVAIIDYANRTNCSGYIDFYFTYN